MLVGGVADRGEDVTRENVKLRVVEDAVGADRFFFISESGEDDGVVVVLFRVEADAGKSTGNEKCSPRNASEGDEEHNDT
ncbi:hypothetical protein AGDE_16720 [Angomonas deanei]|nr:hypothetical protein AGDE_16720 [Angomonas deanei]|eukprot:EPY16540.1 hypothetical protein AGDE_16720 [Angomonas deanei]